MKKLLAFILCMLFVFFTTCCEKAENVKTPVTDITETADITTPEKLKPDLSTGDLYKKYSSIISEYETTYGTISTPNNTDDYEMLHGVSYIELIDFNGDDTEELVIVYFKPFEPDDPEATEYTHWDGRMYMEIFAAQGNEVKNVLRYKLPTDEYRALGGLTVWYGFCEGKTYLGDFMDYSLYMPDEEPNQYSDTDNNYHQWFTSNCYYEYNGIKFTLAYKDTWQGEGLEQIQMFNDDIYGYDYENEKPGPQIINYEAKISAHNFEACRDKVTSIKTLLASGTKKAHISFEEQTKYNSHREIADYLLLKEHSTTRDSDGVYEITDENIVANDKMAKYTVTYTLFDSAYKERLQYNSSAEKTTTSTSFYLDLSNGRLYSPNDDALTPTYLW